MPCSDILSFWTKRPLLSSLHTVAVESMETGGVRVYNYSNSRPDPRELSGFDDFVKKTQYTYFTREALAQVADEIAVFARAEGLEAHARAALVRMDDEEA